MDAKKPCTVTFYNMGGGVINTFKTMTAKRESFVGALAYMEDVVHSFQQSAECGSVEYMDEDACRSGYSDNLVQKGAKSGRLPNDLDRDLCGFIVHTVTN